MSARVHVHLTVSDIEESRGFYEKFLDAEPVKVKSGYVKFLPEVAPVNLALSESNGDAVRGKPSHLGVQLNSTEEVQAQLRRVKSRGLTVREEMGVDCCHANQDKFWVQDPDGLQWEVYTVNYDLEDEMDELLSPEHAHRPVTLQMAPSGGAPDDCCQV